MRRLAIFAGYDKDNIIDDYVVYYIKELKKIADIIYVSDCDILENELAKISEYCINIINGRHGEYDFGSYKRGYLYAYDKNILKDYDYLILCNDSCYGPFFNFQEIVENMENKNTDVWGIFKYLKDIDFEEHLQSYFLAIKKKVFLSEYFYDFMFSVKKENSKDDIVIKYEIGLTTLFLDNDCTIDAFLDSNIRMKKNDNYNVPFFDSYNAVCNKFPFLKVSSITQSQISQINFQQLKKIFKIIKNSYNINLIVNHLNRILTNKKYLYHRFKKFNIYLINKKILNIYSDYIISGKYRIIFKLFNLICITIDLPKSISYINFKHTDFNFLLEEIDK